VKQSTENKLLLHFICNGEPEHLSFSHSIYNMGFVLLLPLIFQFKPKRYFVFQAIYGNHCRNNRKHYHFVA
jgi:hypothetical protein